MLDLAPDATRTGKYDERPGGARDTGRHRPLHNARGLEQILVAAVCARADERLVERQMLGGDFVYGIRIARAERLGYQRYDTDKRELFVDLITGVRAR